MSAAELPAITLIMMMSGYVRFGFTLGVTGPVPLLDDTFCSMAGIIVSF
ncbi:hypothetical protein ACFWFU_40060 [Streptomyces sp. NPDC060235]